LPQLLRCAMSARARRVALFIWVWLTNPRRIRDRKQPATAYLKDDEYASLEDTLATFWVAKIYARYGTDAQMDKIYHYIHNGHWPRGYEGGACTFEHPDGRQCGQYGG
jgi:hypothetical protein